MSDDSFAPDHLEGVEYIMRKRNNDLLGGIIAQQQTRIEELEAKLAQQDDLVQAATERGFWLGRSCGGSKAEIDAALAAIREGGE